VELDVLESNAALDFSFGALASSTFYQNRGLDNVKNLVRSTQNGENVSKTPGNHNTVPQKHKHVEKECGDGAN
jgi:hypothetical protein